MNSFRAFLVCLLAVSPALADGFSSAQRAEIVRVVRDALKSDPTILRDAVAALQDDNTRLQADSTARAIASKRLALLAAPGDPVAGNASGRTTIVEFYDPRCPYCRRMLPGIASLLAQDHDLRLVYKDIPVLGPGSELEARAIVAAQTQGAYLKMQDALMTDAAQPTDAMIAGHARALGLDARKLAADMAGAATVARLNANLELAHSLHVDGTPAFVVGEQIIPGQVDIPTLQAAIAAARARG